MGKSFFYLRYIICYIDIIYHQSRLQKAPYIEFTGDSQDGTIDEEETAYYKYMPGIAGDYVLTYEGDVRVQYSTDKTATKSWMNIFGPDKKHTITLPDDEGIVFLKISHNGAEEPAEYKVSFKKAEYAGFKLRSRVG